MGRHRYCREAMLPCQSSGNFHGMLSPLSSARREPRTLMGGRVLLDDLIGYGEGQWRQRLLEMGHQQGRSWATTQDGSACLMQDGYCSPTVVGGHKEMLIDAVLMFALLNDLATRSSHRTLPSVRYININIHVCCCPFPSSTLKLLQYTWVPVRPSYI